MGSYTDFYEQVFGKYNIGDSIRIAKDGCIYEGTLMYKNEHFITVNLQYYNEAFSVPDFFEGHSRVLADGENIEFNTVVKDDDNIDIDFSAEIINEEADV